MQTDICTDLLADGSRQRMYWSLGQVQWDTESSTGGAYASLVKHTRDGKGSADDGGKVT